MVLWFPNQIVNAHTKPVFPQPKMDFKTLGQPTKNTEETNLILLYFLMKPLK